MKIGILGAADIAFRRFLPALQKCAGVSYAGVASRMPEKTMRFTETFGGQTYPSYDALLADKSIDAVYVPLPPALHYEWGRRTLEAGKHLLMEKPFTTSLTETETLLCLARDNGLKVHENYMFLYHSQLEKIKTIIADGIIGEVRLIRTAFGFPKRCRDDFRYKKELGGGALLDCGGYPVRLALELLGKTVRVTQARLTQPSGYEVDLFGNAVLENAEGQCAQISFGMDNSYKCELELWGSKGALTASRIFTAPDGYQPELVIQTGSGCEKLQLPADNSFLHSIEKMINVVKGDGEEEYILLQATLVNTIQKEGIYHDPFNKASVTDLEEKYLLDALHNSKLSGDGTYTMRVYQQIKERFGIENMLLTTSGTTALEMAAILIDLEPGDEVIVPSFTFSSTVNAFLLRGAKPVFCDIRPDTFNMDETLIEGLVTSKTKAIYCVDYAGIPCEMGAINEIGRRHGLFVIEDAAQALGSTYKGRYAGTLSEFGCYSFHETKNYAMGEGGGIVLNEEKYLDRAEIIREKGTNRRQVLKGWTDKYTWYDIGSSFLPSDLLAAVLSAQLERYDEIMDKRLAVWNTYHEQLKTLEDAGKLRRAFVPEHIQHNGHMYNIVLPSDSIRTKLVEALKKEGIMAYICYVPLHSSPMGRRLGWKTEDCPVTEDYGKRVLRLPLFADMTLEDVEKTVSAIVNQI